MGEEHVAATNNSITVGLKIYMHCDSCERLVRRTIGKMEGVETVEVDRDENIVTVTGDFDSEKVVKRIKKKTGKRATIVTVVHEGNEEDEQEADDFYVPCYIDLVPEQDNVLGNKFLMPARWDLNYFDDDNTQACRIM